MAKGPTRARLKILNYGGQEIPLQSRPDIGDLVKDIEEAITAGGRMVRFKTRSKQKVYVYISADHPVFVMEVPDSDAQA